MATIPQIPKQYDSKRFFTLHDLADMFQLSYETVRRKAQNGDFGDMFQAGDRAIRFSRDVIEAYIANNTSSPSKKDEED